MMDFAAESEEMSGGGLRVKLRGSAADLESDQEEKVRTEESGAGGAENGLTGMGEDRGRGRKESRRRAEEMRIALTVVKQVMDWSEMVEGTLNGQWVKQEDGHEVKRKNQPHWR